MRPRSELFLAGAIFSLLIGGAALLGRRDRRVADFDPRASAFVSTPYGLKGFADVLSRLGYNVDRSREPLQRLLDRASARALIVVARPSNRMADSEVDELLAAPNAVVWAGEQNDRALSCLGYATDVLVIDSLAVRVAGGRAQGGSWARAILVQRDRAAQAERDTESTCDAVVVARTDTLLVDSIGRPVALRLTTDQGYERTIVSDDALLSNAQLRRSSLAGDVITLVAGPIRPVIFAEYYQGYNTRQGTGTAVLAWSRSHPVGWAIWQIGIVGALAFVAGAVRFGPVLPGISRARRSSQEHVKALATALSAAHGHEVAVATLVRGLRRRLELSGLAARGAQHDWRGWLDALRQRAPNRSATDAITRLQQQTEGQATPMTVLNAANSVEDVWEALYR